MEMSKRQLRLILSLLSISWSAAQGPGQGPVPSGPVGAGVEAGYLGGPGQSDGAATPAAPQIGPLGSGRFA
jgi:hypothetical protein